jgi:hypothetical protein
MSTTDDLARANVLADLYANPNRPAPEVNAARLALVEPTQDAGVATVESEREEINFENIVVTMPQDESTLIAETVDVLTKTEVVTVVTTPTSVVTTPKRTKQTRVTLSDMTEPAGLARTSARLNIPVTDDILNRITDLDRTLVLSGRSPISRNTLLTLAAREVIAHPEAFTAVTARPKHTISGSIQGRVDPVVASELRKACYTPTTPILQGPALAEAVNRLLDAAVAAEKNMAPLIH